MASETKVGLLAGLAFIICFAVILANRGQPIPAGSIVDYGNKGHGHSSGGLSGTAQTSAKPSGVGPAAPKRAPRRVDRSPSVGSDLVFSNPKRGPSVPLSASGSGRFVAGEPTTPPEDHARRQQELEARLETLNAKLQAVTRGQETGDTRPDRAPSTAAQAPLEKAAPSAVGRHTVVPGDTLSRIAMSFYGSRSRRAINAIYDANRSVLSNPDVLRIGAVLTLPALDTSTTRERPAGTERAASPRQADQHADDTSSNSGSFTWYQIKPGDRYVSIARDQLGSERRWHEVFELNKDKFPDPQRIRVGVRIKIPDRSTGSAEGRH